MAACQIDLAGTSGTIQVRYNLAGIPVVTTTEYNGIPIYVDDTATDVTYTTLSGDVTASSMCLTVTELPALCYTFRWDGPTSLLVNSHTATKFIVGATEIDIDVPIWQSGIFLFGRVAYDVNLANNPDVSFTMFKFTYPNSPITDITVMDILARVVSTEIPEIRVETNYGTALYIKGELSDCNPVDFEDLYTGGGL